MIEIGSKVVCVDDENWPAFARAVYRDFPVKGKIYTIRDIIPGLLPTEVLKDDPKIALRFTGKVVMQFLLEEIYNTKHPQYGIEMGYLADRFAPVEPPKTEKEKIKESVGFVRKVPTTVPKVKPRELVPA